MNANTPIPLQLLIHSVTVEEAHNGDSDDASSLYPDENKPKKHVLNHVRMQPVDKQVTTNLGDGVNNVALQGSNYLMFIDRQNSVNPDNYIPQVDDTVHFNADIRTVIQVSAMYALGNEPHHWEVLLQ